MMENKSQPSGIIEIALPGEKLDKETTDLDTINSIGQKLYENNKGFLREKVRENWYAVIEPLSGTFIASESPTRLYEYTAEKFPNRLFYVIGLLKNFFSIHVY